MTEWDRTRLIKRESQFAQSGPLLNNQGGRNHLPEWNRKDLLAGLIRIISTWNGMAYFIRVLTKWNSPDSLKCSLTCLNQSVPFLFSQAQDLNEPALPLSEWYWALLIYLYLTFLLYSRYRNPVSWKLIEYSKKHLQLKTNWHLLLHIFIYH